MVRRAGNDSGEKGDADGDLLLSTRYVRHLKQGKQCSKNASNCCFAAIERRQLLGGTNPGLPGWHTVRNGRSANSRRVKLRSSVGR